jgi:hypothetical protein
MTRILCCLLPAVCLLAVRPDPCPAASEQAGVPQTPAAAAAERLRLIESDAAITVTRGETPVVVYNKQSPPVPTGIDPIYRRSGFLHPVASPAGHVVTATFPFDHAHQHGVFTAWVNTTYADRSVDFWNLAGGTGRVLHERVVATRSDGEAVGFEVDLIHRAEQQPAIDVLRERWKVSVYPTDGTYHCFDLETTQQALTETPLAINEYHYGGVALRGPVRWLDEPKRKAGAGHETAREPSSFLNSLGSDRIAGNHEHARWVCLSGAMDGQPVSVAVLGHADNFRAPQAARLHPTKPYFCFSPCVDGSFVIDREHPYHARYRFLVTDAAPDADWLNAQWQTWCGR